MTDSQKTYYTYIIKCADGSLYTGIAIDLVLRIKQHNGVVAGGAKYTNGRRPVSLQYFEQYPSRSGATKREIQLKNMSKGQKLLLIQSAKSV